MPFPYSLFKGIQQPQQNSPIDRRDLLNYTGDNTIQSSRYIDPVTKDFVVSSTNHFMGMNAIDQSVLLALNTTFNSSAQTAFGQNYGSIKMITPNIKAQMVQLLQQALSFLITNNQIVLDQGSIQVFNTNVGQMSISFRYFNNTSGILAPVQFILP